MQGFPSNVLSFPFNYRSFYLRRWEKTHIGHHQSLRIARRVSQHSPPSRTWCMRVHIPFLPSTYPHKFIQHKWKNRNSRTQHSLILWRPPSTKNLSNFHRRLQPLENNRQAKLYPADAVEEVDIGGVTLLRAADKNHQRVSVLSDLKDYKIFLGGWKDGKGDVGESVSCAEGVRDDRTLRWGNQMVIQETAC